MIYIYIYIFVARVHGESSLRNDIPVRPSCVNKVNEGNSEREREREKEKETQMRGIVVDRPTARARARIVMRIIA